MFYLFYGIWIRCLWKENNINYKNIVDTYEFIDGITSTTVYFSTNFSNRHDFKSPVKVYWIKIYRREKANLIIQQLLQIQYSTRAQNFHRIQKSQWCGERYHQPALIYICIQGVPHGLHTYFKKKFWMSKSLYLRLQHLPTYFKALNYLIEF